MKKRCENYLKRYNPKSEEFNLDHYQEVHAILGRIYEKKGNMKKQYFIIRSHLNFHHTKAIHHGSLIK